MGEVEQPSKPAIFVTAACLVRVSECRYLAVVSRSRASQEAIDGASCRDDIHCCAWTPVGPKGPDRVTLVVWALMADREYYEQQQLARLARRVVELE